ncbi:OmpA family protein [Marinobacter alexandrii]|uniref:OmpA family protein n=1 Tax=Marinobacter alexandrii TaxID=2570351 RepID=UPI0011095B8F|nr:OmpA family protein [Marinobacter alexandrii]
MSIMRSCAMAAVAATLVTPAIAEERRDTIYINPFAGFQYFDDKRSLDESVTYGFGVEYRFLPHWAIEGVYSRANADHKYGSGDSDFEEVRVDGTYYFAGPEEKWNPYVSLGAGHADFGNDSSRMGTSGSNHDETRVNVGTGVRYNVTDRFSLRGDLREFHGIDESTFDTQVSLGFSLAFARTTTSPSPAPAPAPVPAKPADSDNDGVIDSRDQCPGTKAGVAVNTAGCELDADNDGVVNSADQCPNTTAGADVDATGCEGVTETIETFEVEVQFPTNSSVIGNKYDDEIRRVADFLKAHPETVVEIGGHSDDRGDADYNQTLSKRRAQAVAKRLTDALGIDPERVTAVGYGETEPVASNTTAEGRAANRRVEARIQVQR